MEKRIVLLIMSLFFLLFPLSKDTRAFGADTISRQFTVKEKEKQEKLHQFPNILEEEDGIYILKEILQNIVEEEMVILTKYSDIYETEEEIPEAPEQWLDEEGKKYHLLKTRLVDAVLPEKHIAVAEEEHFSGLEDISLIPHEKDGERGHLFLSSVTEGGEYWKRDVFFTVLFRGYQASAYMLDGKRILHDDRKPQLEGMETILLEAEGLSADTHRIYEMRWNGGTWLDEEYGMCREAAVFAERLVRDYTAVYKGEFVKAAAMGKQREMIYGYQPERDLDSEVILTARYEKQEDKRKTEETSTETYTEKKIKEDTGEHIEENAEGNTEKKIKETLQENSRESKVKEVAQTTLAALLFLFFFCRWIYFIVRDKHMT